MGQGDDAHWAAVRHAFFSGDYGECRRLLESRPEPEAQIWLARVENRENRKPDVIRRMLSFRAPNERLAAERDVWLASAYVNTGEFKLGHQLLDRALPILKPYDEPYYRGVYVRALAYYLAGDYSAVEEKLQELAQSPDPKDRAQAYAHRSWIAARREDLRAQLRELVRALAEYEQDDEPDQYSLANSLVALSVLCRELPTEGIIDRVKMISARLLATQATAFPRFILLRVLGWIDALHGDEVSALRNWRTAQSAAPSDHWYVFCLVDRAYFSGAMGRANAAQEALAEAHERALRLAWEDTQDEERIVLLVLAQLFAAEDPALAQRYLAQFRSLRTDMDPRIGWVGDGRMRAMQLYPQGIALLHLDERDMAIGMLEEAWQIFASFEYGWRAALAAFELFQATGQARWLERAREHIAPWPQSWIAGQVRNAG